MTTADLRPLIAHDSIAVVGASQRADALGTAVIKNLRSLRYGGQIYPINPRYDDVEGLTCYPSLEALPAVPDAVFAAIPAAGGPAVVEEAGRLGIKAAFINASGYSDGGDEGRALQAQVQASAARYGMAVCGPNNTGIINFHDRVASWTAPMPSVGVGTAAVITQSGSASMVLAEGPRGVGLAYVITAGNEAVTNVADYLGWVVDDQRVNLVILFLETIREPARFEAAALRAAERGVPIVALKIGRSDSGRAAVAAHTGSLAGDGRVYDAFFRRCGIVRADDLDELIELAALFGVSPTPPRTPHTVPITFSGGEAALVADIGTAIGLSMPPIQPAAMERVRASLPPFASPRNPLDAFGLGFDIERFSELTDALLTDDQLGVIVPAIDAPESGGIDAEYGVDIIKLFKDIAGRTDKKLVIANNSASSGIYPQLLELAAGSGIPVLTGMRESLLAIDRWARHRGPAPSAPLLDDPSIAGAVDGLARAREVERFERLTAAGVPFAPTIPATSADEAVTAAHQVGLPVVVKGSAPELLHKTDEGLVAVGLRTEDEVRSAAQRILAALAGRHGELLVQKMVGPGVEIIVGTRHDPQFGTVLVVGPGGVFVEITRDVAVRLGPVDEGTAEQMLGETTAGRLLAGVRGAGRSDIEAAARVIARVSQLAATAGNSIKSLEVNPLIVLPEGEGAYAVDLVVE